MLHVLTERVTRNSRHYAPGMGTFTALDPFEGSASRPMSLNGYTWVEGNPRTFRT